jgi:hypothetical protein
MQFRYDFDKKLDLSRFKKQAEHYIGKMNEITYNFYIENYKLNITIAKVVENSNHSVGLAFYSIDRDADREVIRESAIFPLRNDLFSNITFIKNLFKDESSYSAYFISSSVVDTINKICDLLNLLFKINKLLAFA